MSFYGPRRVAECDVKKGDIVEVVKGRKVPIGTRGQVFWIGTPFMQGMSRWAITSYPIGIKDDSGKVYWTYDGNVHVA